MKDRFAIREIEMQILALMDARRAYRSCEFYVPENQYGIREAKGPLLRLARDGLVDRAKSGANYLYWITEKGIRARP